MRDPQASPNARRDEEGGFPTGEAHLRAVRRRHRQASLWQLLFRASTIVGIVALSALLYNVVTESFGLVAVQNTVEPETLAVDGVPLEELSKEQLLAILEEHVSRNVLRRLDKELPFAERTREDVYVLVQERVVQPKILASWSLTESLLRLSLIHI